MSLRLVFFFALSCAAVAEAASAPDSLPNPILFVLIFAHPFDAR
jgi:hypothetical protein